MSYMIRVDNYIVNHLFTFDFTFYQVVIQLHFTLYCILICRCHKEVCFMFTYCVYVMNCVYGRTSCKAASGWWVTVVRYVLIKNQKNWHSVIRVSAVVTVKNLHEPCNIWAKSTNSQSQQNTAKREYLLKFDEIRDVWWDEIEAMYWATIHHLITTIMQTYRKVLSV